MTALPASDVRVAASADVDPTARIGAGSSVWHLAQVREGASLGRSCVVGRGAYVGSDVRVGDHVKIQNYALVYEPAELADGVFVGPAAVLTNDQHPRAVAPDGTPKGRDDWEQVGVTVREGASLGARSVCVAPVTVGRWATVGAGAVVVADVPDHALVVGVPARQIGWVGRAGVRLQPDGEGGWRCPRTGERYREERDGLELAT
ncbi:acyltransferase [Pseudonocardia sp.]|uniref:acyltransferase n=1 Tax=Pseudonocardia sp. TaxID=60912 RepID=UPI003D0D415C